MTILPVIVRELRVAARRPLTYRVRWMAAGLLYVLWLVMCLVAWGRSPQERFSQDLFWAFGWTAFLPTLMAGVFLTAESVSREKEQGTLGLLFLTDLHGHDVVLGKLIGHSVNALFGLFAVLPLLGIPLLMGGVEPVQFFGLTVVLLATLTLSLAIGVLASVLTRDTRRSVQATLAVIIGLSAVLPVVCVVLAIMSRKPSLLDFLLWPSPAYALVTALNGHNPLGQVTVFLVAAVSCIGIACWRLPSSWRREDAVVEQLPISLWPVGIGGQVNTPADDPAGWLVHRDRRGRRMAWGLVWFLGLPWLLIWLGGLGDRDRSIFFVLACVVGIGIHGIFKSVIALEATKRLSEDAASGALELILATPLAVKTFVDGLARGLHQTLRGPTIAVSLINLLMLAYVTLGPVSGGEAVMAAWVSIAGLAVLWLDRSALIWTGMSQGLRRRGQTRATLATVALIQAPGWLTAALLGFAEAVGAFRGMGPEPVLVTWFLAGATLSGINWAVSRRRLVRELRRIAAGEGVSPVPAWHSA